MSPPSSGPKNKPSKKPDLLATCFTLVSCLAYSSTLTMEAICSSETSVDFQRTARRYISKDRTLYFRDVWSVQIKTKCNNVTRAICFVSHSNHLRDMKMADDNIMLLTIAYNFEAIPGCESNIFELCDISKFLLVLYQLLLPYSVKNMSTGYRKRGSWNV
jgi:hypothetical protein